MARTIAYIGYIWMAFVFLFFFFNVTFEIIVYLYKLVGSGTGCYPFVILLSEQLVFLAFIFVVYGFFDARQSQSEKLWKFKRNKYYPITVKSVLSRYPMCMSGLIIREKRLQAILDRVREAKPDILVSTGDLLDGELDNVMPEARAILAAITSKVWQICHLGQS